MPPCLAACTYIQPGRCARTAGCYSGVRWLVSKELHSSLQLQCMHARSFGERNATSFEVGFVQLRDGVQCVCSDRNTVDVGTEGDASESHALVMCVCVIH
jgi:hypothetical protein